MRALKDAPMACTASNKTPFLSTLDANRTECIRTLDTHEHETPDRYWRPGDPQARPPKTSKAKPRMRLVLNMTTRNTKPEFPPRYTRLSDELVYLATKFLKARDRARDYPYDFHDKGDIDPARIPSGVAPLIWAHGLPFFPIYKGYYILCGRQHAKWIGWLLNRKEFNTTKQFPIWSVGPVVAPSAAVNMPRTVERQLRMHKPLSVDDVDGPWDKSPAARDVVSTEHWDLSVVPTVAGGYRLMPIYRVRGYDLRCGPDWENGRAASFGWGEDFENEVVDVDYDGVREVVYANERCPGVDSDDFDLSESEEEDEGSKLEEVHENQADGPDETANWSYR